MGDFYSELFPADQMNTIADAAVDATTQINDDGMMNSRPVKRKRSVVWDYFFEIKDANGRRCGGKCTACGQEYKISSRNGTSPLLAHLKKRCTEKRNGDGEEHSEMTAITDPVVSQEKMILEDRYPVTGQSLDYKDLLENLENYYLQLQLYGSLRAVILRNYKEEKERLCADFRTQSFGRFNLSINLLRRGTVVMYCCLALQYIDDAWKPKKKVVAFKRVAFSTHYLEVSATFISMLLDWNNVHKNVFFITAENTEEADQIVSEIKRWLVNQNLLPFGGNLSHVNCFLHLLNHLIEVGLCEVRDIKCKIVICVDYIRNTRAEYDDDDLRNAVENVRSEVKKVTSEDMAVSWNLDLPMLERLLSLRNAFDQFKTFDSTFKESNPTVIEWETATRICSWLKWLEDTVRSFTVSSCLTTNLYFPKVCSIYYSLRQWRTEKYLGVRLMANKMMVKFDKYWKTSIVGLAIAVILDPRFKFNIVEGWFTYLFGNDAGNQCQTIRNILEEVYNEYAGGSKNSASSSCDASSSTSYITDYCDMLGPLGLPFTSNELEDGRSKKSELQLYLEGPTIDKFKNLDVLDWWHLYEPYFPRLAKMARDFLAIPMSAALSNPSFNNDVKKIDAVSIDLDPEIIEHIISLKDWSSTT